MGGQSSTANQGLNAASANRVAGNAVPQPLQYYNALPKGVPVTTGGVVAASAMPLLNLGTGALAALFAVLITAYVVVGKPFLQNLEMEGMRLREHMDALIDSYFQRTDARARWTLPFLKVCRILLEVVLGALGFGMDLLRNILVVAILLIIAYLAKAIEVNSETMVGLTGVTWETTRQGMNTLFAGANSWFLLSTVFLVPGWNITWKFVGGVLLLTSHYFGASVLAGASVLTEHNWHPVAPETGSVNDYLGGGTGGTGGRRVLLSMLTNDTVSTAGKYNFDQFANGRAEWPVVAALAASFGGIVATLASFTDFLYTAALILISLFMQLLLNFPEAGDFALALISAPGCYLMNWQCAIQQIIYVAGVIIIEIVNIFLGALSFLGVSKINPDDTFVAAIQCTTPPADAALCNQCILAFPGWKSCPADTGTTGYAGPGSSGRRLISCEQVFERSATVWYESVGERAKPRRTVAEDAQTGCPLTHRAFHPIGHADNMHMFGRYACYDVCVNGTLVHACPENERHHETVYATTGVPCGTRRSLYRATESDEPNTRRNLATAKMTHYVSTVFGRPKIKFADAADAAKVTYVTGPDGRAIPIRPLDESRSKPRISAKEFETRAAAARKSAANYEAKAGGLACSSSAEGNGPPTSDWFSAACYLQTATMHAHTAQVESMRSGSLGPFSFSLPDGAAAEKANAQKGWGRRLSAAEREAETARKGKWSAMLDMRALHSRMHAMAHNARITAERTRRILEGHAPEPYHVRESDRAVRQAEQFWRGAYEDFLRTLGGGHLPHGYRERNEKNTKNKPATPGRGRKLVSRTESVVGTVFIPANRQYGTCPAGFDLCPGGQVCEPTGQCACPATPYSEGNSGFINTATAYMHGLRCDLQQVNPVAVAGRETQCWQKLINSDQLNPFHSFAGVAPGTSAPNKLYCWPMTEGISWRIPAVTWDFKTYIQEVCGTATTLKSCQCPDYMAGQFVYGADWKVGIPLEVQVCLYNGVTVVSTFVGGVIYLIAGDSVNSAWQFLVGWIPLVPPIVVTFFDKQLTQYTMLCATKHVGEFVDVVVFALFFYWILKNAWRAVFYMVDLCVDVVMGTVGFFVPLSDTTRRRLERKEDAVRRLEDRMSGKLPDKGSLRNSDFPNSNSNKRAY